MTALGATAAAAATRPLLAYDDMLTLERRLIVDEETGVNIWQITSFPTVHQNLYFHGRAWTGDGDFFMFTGLHEHRRGSVEDLYLASVEGTGLTQVTDGREWGSFALHPQRAVAFINVNNQIHIINLTTGESEPFAKAYIDGEIIGRIASMTDDGRYYCFAWLTMDEYDPRWNIGVLDTQTREIENIEVQVEGRFTHLQIEPGQGQMFHWVGSADSEGRILYVCDRQGKIEPLPVNAANGHNAWLGNSGWVYSNLIGDQRDVIAMKPFTDEFKVIAKAPPSFWHTGVSPEGNWMVSDTSNPDAGLHLINVETGRHAPLCSAKATQGHSQYTHPHPCVGPGARHVVFNSDQTGIPHVYCAEIPDSLKEKLS